MQVIDLTGNKYGKLTVLGSRKTIRGRTTWECSCECGNNKRFHYDALVGGGTKSCGCNRGLLGPENPTWTGFGEISGKFWAQIKAGARQRSLEFTITIEDAWNLFLKQKGICALSAMPLSIRKKRDETITASLDRVDNRRGYTPDNVQWIHKDLNMMKRHHEQNYFIDMCRKVARNFAN